jgi:multidrug efflux pump subunit AcrB
MSSLIAWFARNATASNLVMLALLVGGAGAALSIKQEVYPSFQLDFVDVRMSYPGASPEEVADAILLPIEEQMRSLDIAERVTGTAEQGRARVEVELAEGIDPNRAVQEVTNAVGRVSFFPEDAERPTISIREEQRRIMWLALYGALDERQMFGLAERVRSDLIALPEISRVNTRFAREPEISLEIPQATFRALELTPREVAELVRNSARDVPGGGVRTPGGEVLLRAAERRDLASAYGDIPLVSTEDGSKVLLSDVATVTDGFVDVPMENYYNGGRGVFVMVYAVGDEKPLEVAAAVNRYMKRLNAELPEGTRIDVLQDQAAQYESRLWLLAKNGTIGLALVLLVCGLFLEPRLALWVAIGVPTTLIGAVALLPALGASINMISLFAFIVTLGIVVDDAVIVGENVFHKIQQGVPRMTAAVEGAWEMAVPVLFAVATNVIAFVPLLLVPGETGRFFAPLPAVVIAVFVVSIVEALFILPSHLGHGRSDKKLGWLTRQQRKFSDGFERATDRYFVPLLHACLRFRYLTLAGVAGGVVIILAYYQSGRVDYNFTPVISGLRVDAEVETAPGAPFSDTVRVATHVHDAGYRAAERLGNGDAESVLRGRMNVIGRLGENWADVNFILVPPQNRDFDQATFAEVWREEIGTVSGLDGLFFEWEEGPGSGAGLTVELSHRDREQLESSASTLAERMATYTGITDVRDGFAAGKPQLDVELKPAGRSLGLTSEDVARQVRSAFYGAEALRFQRGRHEVRVMVRLPAEERRSLAAVENLIIRTPSGGETTLAQVAALVPGRAPTEVTRIDGRRVVSVSGNVDTAVANINAVRAALETEVLPELRADYPGLSVGFGGRQREEARAMDRLRFGLLFAAILVYALLAALFRSHAQALVVMGVVPFAIAAAVLGHVLLGYDLSVVSLFGIIAVGGLAVNGGLVLVKEANRRRDEEQARPLEAAAGAARRRLRPILLTSLTTFAGLFPMILETDPQALFLVPMAIALGVGTLFSGLLLPITVPAGLMVLADVRAALRRLYGTKSSDLTPAEA